LDFILPKIYPITDTRISGLSHAAQVEQMIAGGATLIQLREKHESPRDSYQAAADAIEIARSHGVQIIINDRVDLAFALKGDGVHLGQDDMPPDAARPILGEDAIIGFSTHSIEQVRAAVKLPIVFRTLTKADPDAVVGIELLRTVRDLIGDMPLVAIGGITAKNVRLVIDAGADSAAIIGAIVSEPAEITAKMRELLQIAANDQ